MSVRLSKESILKDRYEVFAASGRSARRADRAETWFFESTDCRSILRSGSFTAKRSGPSSQVKKFDCIALGEFFDDWLMFRDDDFHGAVKPIIGKWLTALMRDFRICSAPKVDFGRKVDLVAEFAGPFVIESFATFFALDGPSLEAINRLTSLAIAILGYEEVEQSTAQAADAAIIEAKGLITGLANAQPSTQLIYNSLVELVGRRSTENILLNVLTDGIHPTIAALSSEILLQILHGPIERTNDNPNDLIFFQEEAPFQYIARIATSDQRVGEIDLRAGERVVACVAQCSRSGDVDLIFGAGRHRCPGSQIALRVVTDGVRAFRELTLPWTLSPPEPKWQDSIGYRALTSLYVHIERNEPL